MPSSSKPTRLSCAAGSAGASFDGLGPDEAPASALHEALEAGFEGRGRVVELVPVEGQGGLEAQRIPRAEAGGHEPWASPASSRLEDALGVGRIEV